MSRESNSGLNSILVESGTNEVEFLEFIIAGQGFGVNVAKVAQTIVLSELTLTRLPGAPSEVLGSVYFRGKPITVIDLKAKLGLENELLSEEEAKKKKAQALLIVLEFNEKTHGFVIDGIESIHRISWDQFNPLIDEAEICGHPSIAGSIIIKNKIILILDVETLVSAIDPLASFSPQSSQIDRSADKVARRNALKIIYCEDSPVIRNATQQLLRESGYRDITPFATGAEALKYIKSKGPKEIDIIISDIEMPDMDGLTLCKNIRAMEEFKDHLFVVYSSLINEQMKSKCASVGVSGSYSKSDMLSLVQFLEQSLGDLE